MKWFPTILVLAAFGVLIWVSSKKPETTPETAASHTTATATDDPGAHGQAPGHAEGAHPTEAPAPAAAPAGGAATGVPAPIVAPVRKPDSIMGQVVDAAGSGKGGMQVSLRGAGGKEAAATTTDPDGRFAFDRVAPGTWWLSAFDPDYLYTTATTEKVTLDKGRTAEAKVSVKRGNAGISGIVTDADGKPVADRRITLTAGGAAISVTTDAKGAYLVNGLAEGDWKVTPQDYPELAASVRPRAGGDGGQGGIIAQQNFTLTPKAALEVTVVGSHLHPAKFRRDEQAFLRPPGDSDRSRWHRHGVEILPPPAGEHGEHAKVVFANVAPGDWEFDVVDAAGTKSLLTGRESWSAPIPVKLAGGETRTWSLPTAAAARGAGVEVPFWAQALMFTVIGLLIFVTPIVFPAPLVAKRPPAIRPTVPTGA